MFFFVWGSGIPEALTIALILGSSAATWWWLYRSSDRVRQRGMGEAPDQQPVMSEPMSPAAPSAPAGWYPVDGGRRYWNGQSWSSPVIHD